MSTDTSSPLIGIPYTKCKNSADTSNHPTPSVPLTTKEVTIRKDMVKQNGQSINWDQSWNMLKESLNEDRLQPVIEYDGEDLEITPKPKMFSKDWMGKSYGKMMDGGRRLLTEYNNPSIVFITLTASGYTNGQYTAPIDQYLDLDRSWTIPADQLPNRSSRKRPIYEKLKYGLDNKRDVKPAYAFIDGVHDGRKSTQSGSDNRNYAHRHGVTVIEGDVTDEMLEDTFYPIIDEHLKYCDSASKKHHKYTDAIRYDNNPNQGLKPIHEVVPSVSYTDVIRGNVHPFIRDLASHLPDVYNGGQPDRLFAGMMYAINKKSWRDNGRFRQAFKREFAERERVPHPDDWESDGDGDLKGWMLPDGTFKKHNPDDDSDNDSFLTTSEPIPRYYD